MMIPNANVKVSFSCWMGRSVWTPQSIHPKPDALTALQIPNLLDIFDIPASKFCPFKAEGVIYDSNSGWWITLRDKVASTWWDWYCKGESANFHSKQCGPHIHPYCTSLTSDKDWYYTILKPWGTTFNLLSDFKPWGHDIWNSQR